MHEHSFKILYIKSFVDQKPHKGTLANSEEPDEMRHDAAFHQGLHCLLIQNRSSKKKIQLHFGGIITSDPTIYI